MAVIKVKCPFCGSEEISLYGKNSTTGRQRYLCRNKVCSHKTFQMEYKNNACRAGTKEKIVEMTMNGAGTRDTGRVLKISPNTVTKVLKKRENSQNKSMKGT
ncbi:MAG: IS1 family transposase [Lachnospiraceae bacterium]|nr:IS1 family transposase [Lachnospiraceae bacterium]